MKVRALTLLIGASLCLCMGFLGGPTAKSETKTMSFSSDDAFFLPGLGAVIMAHDKKLTIDMMPSSENIPKELRSVDLKQGDQILMLNGKRVKNIADLREKYEALAEADTVEFGIKRGKNMQIVSFLKPEDSMQGSGHRIMMMTSEGPPPGSEEEGGSFTKVMTMGGGEGESGAVTKVMTMGGDGNVSPILAMEAGVMFAEKDGGVEVMVIIGNAKTELTSGPLKEGDRLVSCQGEAVTGGEAFRKQFESIKVGTTVTLVYMRDGAEHTVSFPKAKTQPMMMRKSG